MIYTPFSPRHKTPYGAVPSGTAVTFTLRPARSEGFSSGLLLARLEQDGDRLLRIPMPWVSTDYQEDVFTSVLDTSGYVGLVWYSFQLEGLDGRCQTLGPYQLTVYDGSQPVPDWFGDGLCYQIFPDRFCKGAMAPADPCTDLGQRLFHQHWQEEPLDGSVGVDANGIAQYNRDFFGGNLSGITEKLDFLADLGVETLYLCPIFRSAENHRYSTADYETIDPLLGTEADFRTLCDAAHARGMRVLLDGVFSHTGSSSRYFQDATRSQTSPFSPWYQWKHWPDDYHCWWGVPTRPRWIRTVPAAASTSMEMKTPSSAAGSEPERTAGDWTWQMSCRTPSLPVCGRRWSRRTPTPWCWARCGRTAPTRSPTAFGGNTCWAATWTA